MFACICESTSTGSYLPNFNCPTPSTKRRGDHERCRYVGADVVHLLHRIFPSDLFKRSSAVGLRGTGKQVEAALSWKDKEISELRAEIEALQLPQKRKRPADQLLAPLVESYQAVDAAIAEEKAYNEKSSTLPQ